MPARRVKVGLVQMSMSDDRGANVAKALRLAEEAVAKGAGIVCLPELFPLKYFPTSRRSELEPEPVPGPTSALLADAARRLRTPLVGGSVYEEEGRRRYNTCLVIDEEGRTLSKYRKVHIPQDEHYYEQDYFSPGDRYSVAGTSVGRVGTLICFDQWYPEAARANRLMGAEMLFYPTAIGWVKGVAPVEGDWKGAWESVQVGHAIANSVVVCAVNRVGTEGDTTFWGGSFVCDQFGKMLFRAGEEEGGFAVECDLDLARVVEEGWGFIRNRQKGTYGALTG